MTRPEQGSDYSRLFGSGYLNKSNEKDVLAGILQKEIKGKTFSSALDIGPGDGRITKILAEQSQNITAVEVEREYCRLFRETFKGACLIGKPIQDVDFPKNSFDLIMANHMLYYLPLAQWQSELVRFYSWLKPQGTLIVTLNAPDCEWWAFVHELAGRLKTVPGFDYTDVRALFGSVCGGAQKFVEYSSQLVWQNDREGLVEFLISIFLALPSSLLTDHNKNIVNEFVEEHLSPDGSFSVGEHAVMGVWRRK